MTNNKTKWCPDLSCFKGPKYRAIVQAMEQDIQQGLLRPGDKMPTQRDLAWSLGLNLSTVTDAYREATRKHLIAGEVGRGTFILASAVEAQLYAPGSARSDEGAGDVIDLSTNIPARALQDKDVREALQTLMQSENLAQLMEYHSPSLLQRCRQAIAHFYQPRGFHPRTSDIFPCAGAQAALYAALQMITKPDMAILVEEFTFPGMKVTARQLGLRLIPVAMDEEGLIPDDLDRAARASGARILVASPILQNPTGASMGPSRRRAIANSIEQLDLTLVEEDVYGAFTTDPPLSLHLAGRALLVGGFSKLVAPGPRFGFVISMLDEARLSGLSADELVHTTSWMTAPLMLALACQWVETGTAEEHMDWQRQEARGRQIMVRRKLANVMQVPALGKAPAAPHLWINVTDTMSSGDQLAAKARAHGVEVVPASTFCAGRMQRDGLRLCLTAPLGRASLTEACQRLTKAWRE
ncbi:MAG: PLP-dependent aminotransferase family protein [Cohaesibacter sp.]|nr:PLP-dependent aminotransferase family protein [Cohaesibacter sp.]MCV6602137.1 PLP-dependent aminotransferase family protein [Cohaesibacter sp.]